MTTSAALCKGYGGLELAAEAILGPMEHLWYAENDPHASIVCEAHWPGVPNLGDLTTVDWTRVPPVDVLTAGFPCQPVSSAGRREGVDDDRWLWDAIAAAVGRMVTRPRLLLLENVRGLLSANGGHAMARVVHGLAALGYVGRYGVFSAALVGAPHRRERVFIAAWPAADAHRDPIRPQPVRIAGSRGATVAGNAGSGAHGVTLLPTPNAAIVGSRIDTQLSGDGRERPNKLGWAVGSLLPTPRASDTGTPGRRAGEGYRPPLSEVLLARVTPTADVEWGGYGTAVARWEQATRPAPDAVQPSRKGKPQLDPRFVEWLMGLPAGWVTDHLPRNPALKCLGNGVVWQQAAHAYTELLGAS